MTDEEQAEAVVAGLSRQIICDCGALHSYGSRKPVKRQPGQYMTLYDTRYADCECGSRHAKQVYCKCGTTWDFGPRKGWKMIGRKHATWVAIEKKLRARIAELEARL